MWSAWSEADLFLFTANGVVNSNTHRLVMGAGIAKTVKNRFAAHEIDLKLGLEIEKTGSKNKFAYHYGLLVSPNWPQAKLGAFQTKTHWRDDSTLSLIQFSTNKLNLWCQNHPESYVHLNFPGIGKGNLKEKDVLPVLQRLPNTVHIWKF